MTIRILRFESTPNPNALKCVLSGPLRDTPCSFPTPASAAGDELAESLFEIEGVRNLLLINDWITIGKDPAAAWPPIRRAVTALLESDHA